MKAAVVNELGQAPHYQDFAEPKPEEGEALVNVRAAGLHPIFVKALASGSHYAGKGEVPAIPGIDGVGTLEDVPADRLRIVYPQQQQYILDKLAGM